MRKVTLIDIKDLEPGMVLADDIRQSPSGDVLLSAGNLLTEKKIKRVRSLASYEKCYIYEPQGESKELHNNSEIEIEGMNPLPSIISSQAKEMYTGAFQTLKDFYSSPEGDINDKVVGMKKTADNLAAEIVKDPQVLMQISFLKAIDEYTFSHAIHVAIYVTALGQRQGIHEKDLPDLCLAGLLHDIGKVDIPRDLVEKPGPLTDEEYDVMKQHVKFGYDRAKQVKNIRKDILEGILSHHEKVDGTGYLKGLKGEEIHPWARLISVADVYDALTTNRSYREALLPHEGAEILMGNSGKLDFKCLTTFIHNNNFYPLGAKVMLNNGEIGEVIKVHPAIPLRPIIRINKKDNDDSNGEEKVIDLLKELTILITHIIKE